MNRVSGSVSYSRKLRLRKSMIRGKLKKKGKWRWWKFDVNHFCIESNGICWNLVVVSSFLQSNDQMVAFTIKNNNLIEMNIKNFMVPFATILLWFILAHPTENCMNFNGYTSFSTEVHRVSPFARRTNGSGAGRNFWLDSSSLARNMFN